MRNRSTLLLFLSAMLIAGIYFLYVRPAAQEKRLMEDFEKRFFRADTSDIEFIRLDAGRGPVTITQTASGWKITEPEPQLPDEGVISRMLETLSKGRLIKVVGDKDDLEKFGFDKTWVVLALGYKGKIDVLRIGGENPSSTGNYAFSERLGKVFLVNRELAMDLNLKPYDLREKRFFIFKPAELGRIRINKKGLVTELVNRDGRWLMMLPEKWEGSKDDIEGLVHALHTQKSVEFIPWKAEYSRLPEKLHLELYDRADGLIGSYDVYFWGTEWYKGILMHVPGSSEAGRTRREFWELLSSDYSEFMYRNLFRVDSRELTAIKITTGETVYTLEKRTGEWFMNGSPVSAEAVDSLVTDLNNWKAVKLIDEERSLGKAQYKIVISSGSGTEKIEISNFNMDYEISGAKMFVPVESGSPEMKKIDYWYTRSSNLKKGAIASSIDIEKIISSIKKLNE